MVLSVTVTAIVRWRIERNEQKAAAIQARKSSSKAKKVAPEDPPKKPERPPPKPKSTVLGTAAREHLAEKSFISELRATFQWRSSQPRSPETDKVLLEKLSAISIIDLPPERKSAWLSLLEAWRALQQPAGADNPQVNDKGRRAAETLNLMLKAHGDLDLYF